MQFTLLILALSLAALSSAAPALQSIEKRFAPWPGKCTIGMESTQGEIPGGSPATGAGANTVVNSMYSYIVGSDGVQTNFDVKATGHGADVTSDGNYGGIDGGPWHIAGVNPHATNMGDITITFNGITFEKSTAPPGTCDCYHSAKPFSQTSGCRCRFDCK